MKGKLKALGLEIAFEVELEAAAPTPAPQPEPAPVPTPQPDPITAPTLSPVVTLQPSFKGARVGEWLDVVESPVPAALPAPRGMPFYMELQFDRVSRAHGLADEGSTLKARADLVKRYIALYRQHGVEPIKQAISGPYEMDWDRFKEYGCSFRQLVIEGAVFAPCIFGAAPGLAPSIAYLQKVEAAIKSGELPKGSWCYPADEPHSATDRAAALVRCKLIKQYAPSLIQKITLPYDAEFAAAGVSVFHPVFEQRDAKSTGGYGSCMAQGSCDNAVVGTPTGTPMLGCVEADPIHPFAYAIVGYACGAREMIYYSGTEAIETCDKPGGLRLFAGNGDGTLVHKNARASYRLTLLAHGLRVVEAAMKNPAALDKLKALVQSPTVWDKDFRKYIAAIQ